MELGTPIQYVPGVGPKRAKLFNKLGVFTIEDLLNYFPREWTFPIENIEGRLADIIKWRQLKFNRK